MDMWFLIMEIVLLLGLAFVLGAVAQRLNQSAIVGYLLAGAILGPVVFNKAAVQQVAERGVALLLFSIGLEFSFSRLRRMGTRAFTIGVLQIFCARSNDFRPQPLSYRQRPPESLRSDPGGR